MGVIFMRFPVVLGMLCLAAMGWGAEEEGLAERFRRPPQEAKPWVYWFWMNGNLTREGISGDLEAMRRVGIGGAIVMEIDSFIPAGPVRFFSPEWRSIWQHAMREASRLGITIAMNNDAGWMGSGGPWVRPELSMQMVVGSESRVRGGGHVTLTLARPKENEGFYRDIAVLAFPTPSGEARRMIDLRPRISVDGRALDAAKLGDGNTATFEELPAHGPGQEWVVEFEFPEAFRAQSLTVAFERQLSAAHGVVEWSSDGKQFQIAREFDARWPLGTLNFAAATGRFWRVRLSQDGRTAVTLPVAELELSGGTRVEGLTGKAAYAAEASLPAGTPGGGEVARGSVVDLSSKMDGAGRLEWDAPAGEWTVLRIGHTSTGKRNHPAPKDGIGLECDKLSAAAVEAHFAGMMGEMVKDQKAAGAGAMRFAHIDSWESGSQNWTVEFRTEFQRLRGYDVTAYLPVLLGRVVDGPEQSERFLWDVRRTVADLINERYAERFRTLSHAQGMEFSLEGYGAGPLDDLAYTGRADLPITEFWMGMAPGGGVKLTTSAAHTYGKPVVAAEAFTSRAPAGRWLNHPYRLKALGDEMLTKGVNRFLFHRFIAQPWEGRRPGMSMGPYGIEFDRTATWWEQSRAYLEYLARCQFMLQQGRFVADVAFLDGENVGRDFQTALQAAAPAGYDFDLVSQELLVKMTVRDGWLELPTGMRYRVLVMPAGSAMRVERLREVRRLVREGATVVGAPPAGSPSLAEMGAGDAEIRQMVREMWGGCDGVNRVENRFGRGRVLWGRAVETALPGPDFMALGGVARYVHRTVEGREVYFVASAESGARTLLCSFRVSGMRPALWRPESGAVEKLSVYEQQGGVTRVPLKMDPFGAVFVVFEKEEGVDPVVSVMRNGVELSGLGATVGSDLSGASEGVRVGEGSLEVSAAGRYVVRRRSGAVEKAEVGAVPEAVEVGGEWAVSFPPGLGAPGEVRFDRLLSWPDFGVDGVRFFSGTATYRKKVVVPEGWLGEGRTLTLDLGRVAVIAEVRWNGQELGVLWKPPFRVEVSGAARAGENELEVRVTNLWVNRLIGDEELPPDMEWDGTKPVRWPAWLLEGRPSPAGRVTMITRRHWYKGDGLVESGLLGPVRLEAGARVLMRR